MKDYSMNLEERKDFILGYDIAKGGQIKIKFAKGKPWYVPYNEDNEKKILDKMKKQLENPHPVTIEDKYKKNILKYGVISAIFVGLCPAVAAWLIPGGELTTALILSSIPLGLSIPSIIIALETKLKLDDLRKNIKFIEMEDKLNKVARMDENTLVGVSSKTKNVINDFSEDREIFNINSFNYVPFRDLEQIMENAARNERFGFNYDSNEEVKGFVRKRVK